jgi:hypothetical protein
MEIVASGTTRPGNVRVRYLTSGTAGSVSTTTSGAVIIPANALILVGIASARSTAVGDVPTSVVFNTGTPYNLVDGTAGGVQFNTIGTPRTRLSIWRGMVGTGATDDFTITWPAAQNSGMAYIVCVVEGVDTSGTNGSGAVVQVGTGAVDAGTALTIGTGGTAFSAFGSANNGVITFSATDVSVAMTPGTGLVSFRPDLVPVGTATKAAWMQGAWAWANNTAPSETIGSSDGGTVGMELKSA